MDNPTPTEIAVATGDALADELFPAVLGALTKPLPAEWDQDALDGYAFDVVATVGAGIKAGCADLVAAGDVDAAQAEIVVFRARKRIVRRMRAVGLLVPFKTGARRDG